MVDDSLWFRPLEPLERPFAALGATVGFFVSDLCATFDYLTRELCLSASPFRAWTPSWGSRFGLGLLFAISFAAAGRWTSAQLLASPGRWGKVRAAILAVFGAGLGGATFLGLMTLGRELPASILYGGLTACLCLPLAIILIHEGASALAARRGTLLHRTYRRVQWVDVAIGMTLVASLYANPMFGHGIHFSFGRELVATGVVIVAVGAGLTALLRALADLGTVLRLSRRFSAAEAVEGADAEREAGVPIIDLGLGDARLYDLHRGKSAYRGHDRLEAVCVGDVARARRVLWAAGLR
ncbi:MAG: hypothetical protein KC731_39695, partial [Myxococcales bacterium]|nr:hypothetical protein [Myxococcales bacterium]